MTGPAFREFVPGADDAALIDLLTTETWAHRVKTRLTEEDVRGELADGAYGGANLTFLVELDGEVVGLVRAQDCGDERQDPQLDFRLRERVRGRGLGGVLLEHITRTVFERFPDTRRIEGQTRQDNVAMRKVFARGGYVKEAVYRRGWPAPGAEPFDGIGYAILREDWETGSTTPVDWAEEPA